MQQDRKTDQRKRQGKTGPAVRTVLSWIVETDRRFRMTQSHIDRFADRF